MKTNIYGSILLCLLGISSLSMGQVATIFGSEQTIGLGADGATDVCAADLDGDGDKEVISVSFFDNEIAWYDNMGGSFSGANVISSTLTGPYSVFAADLDNDGDMDILSGGVSSNSIQWFENLGGGTFATEQIISTSTFGPFDIEAYDMDNDGDKDIIVAASSGHEIVWFRNLGGGSFGVKRNIGSSTLQPRAVEAVDLNGDGLLDIVSTSEFFDRIEWYRNLGGGDFSGIQPVAPAVDGAWDITSADVDGDGDQDLIGTSIVDDKVAWYENLGTGTFAAQQLISTVDNPRRVLVNDFDLDGTVELLAASFNGDEILAADSDGAGNFDPMVVISSTVDGPYSIFADDLDGDGDLDLLSASFNDDKIAWFENLTIDPVEVCTVSTTFDNVLSTPLDDSPENMIELSTGGYLMVGKTENYGTAGETDIQVLRVDCEGNQVWAKAYGDILVDEGGDAVELADGFLITGGMTNVVTGVKNVAIMRISSNGDLIWTKTIETAEESEGQSMDKTLDGNFIIGGFVFNSGNENGYILKVDINGDTLWTKTIDLGVQERINWIAQRQTGGFYISGRKKTSTPGIDENGFVGKYDDLGNEIWLNELEDSTSIYDGTISNGGGIVCVGRKRLPGNEFGAIASKFGPGGLLDWTKYYNDGSRDFAGSVTNTSYGYLVGGRNRDGAVSIDRGWLLRLDEAGDTINANFYAPLGADFFRDVLVADDGDVVLLGVAGGAFGANSDSWILKITDEGPATCLAPADLAADITPAGSANLSWTAAPNHQGYQMKGGPAGGPFGTFIVGTNSVSVGGLAPGVYEWRARAKCMGGEISSFSPLASFTIPTLRLAAQEVKLYPNPARDRVRIEFETNRYQLLEIKDLLGRSLKRKVISDTDGINLDVAGFERGIYLLELSDGQTTFTQKLILE